MDERLEKLVKSSGIYKKSQNLTKDNWKIISEFGDISIEIIREYKHFIDWAHVIHNKNLTDEIIRKFSDHIRWFPLSVSRKMSDDFLLEFSDKIFWNQYFYYQNASFSIMKQFISKTVYKNINEFHTIRLNKIEKQEIQKILDFKYLFSS